jgi:cyclophilin family peptidyl-prolyl cis-trans isomerase
MKRLILILVILVFITSGCGKVSNVERTHVKFETNMGVMEFELYDDLVPKTAGNFKNLVKDGFYDGLRFHRIIKNFMVQGGDPLSKDVSKKMMWGTGGPGFQIDDEFVDSLKHDKKGLLSMANSGPNTGGSQFFITLVPTPWLDGKHAIFGGIVSGEDVLEKIGNVQTGQGDVPVEDVIIIKATIS